MTEFEIKEFWSTTIDQDASRRIVATQGWINEKQRDGWELYQFETNVGLSGANRLMTVYTVIMAKYD